jgi:hypothetical protein
MVENPEGGAVQIPGVVDAFGAKMGGGGVLHFGLFIKLFLMKTCLEGVLFHPLTPGCENL